MDTVERVAEVVLYEGYLLYPYTRSALKNQQRWTFGGVYPRQYSEASGGTDPWLMQTQCLVLGGEDTEIAVKVRFLQIVDRLVLEGRGPDRRPAEELRVGKTVHRPWEESVEREILAGPPRLGHLAHEPHRLAVTLEENEAEEPVLDGMGIEVGALVRQTRAVDAAVAIGAERVDAGIFRLTVTITNQTPLGATDLTRAAILRHTLISTHTILRVREGAFVSLLEPPPGCAAEAQACVNIKTWPVLAGEPGSHDTILSSPIILYDYPRIAPETPGDLFDATEIDELLRLSVMTLTDEEKREMRETDPRTRQILERTEALTPEELLSLHGVIREWQTGQGSEP